MKPLSDYIWNDEDLREIADSKDCTVSSFSSLTGDLCLEPPPSLTCDVPAFDCNVVEPPITPPLPPLSNCPAIDPLHINGCILPMGVSCGGGGGVGSATLLGCISPDIGIDLCVS